MQAVACEKRLCHALNRVQRHHRLLLGEADHLQSLQYESGIVDKQDEGESTRPDRVRRWPGLHRLLGSDTLASLRPKPYATRRIYATYAWKRATEGYFSASRLHVMLPY